MRRKRFTRACSRLASTALACALALPGAAPGAAPPSKSNDGRPSEIDWRTSPLDLDLRGMNGERYAFRCPPGKPVPGRVSGSGPYTDDSSICTAAVHAGAIRPKDGGAVTIEIRPGQTHYEASERNYIRTGNNDAGWDGSFIVLRDGATTDH